MLSGEMCCYFPLLYFSWITHPHLYFSFSVYPSKAEAPEIISMSSVVILV
jgi:hypothetical protein